MLPGVGFEPTVSGGKRPQTYALDRAATVTGLTILPTDLFLSIEQDEPNTET